MGPINVPSSFVGNNDPTAVLMLALANRVLKDIRELPWQVVLSTHTFATVASTSTYALPSTFDSFANLTQWDRTNYEKMEGPVSPVLWEALRSGNVTSVGIVSYFRISGSLFEIYPTPSAVATIAYQFYSNQPITSKTEFSDDTDVSLIYEDLITLGLKYLWRRAKGLDWAADEKDYRRAIDVRQAKDGGKNVIRFGPPRETPMLNIPDVGFGS